MTTKTIQDRFDEMRDWMMGLSSGEQSIFRMTAQARLNKEFEGSDQGIGSSDISCEMLSVYKDFILSGDASIVNYCLDAVNNIDGEAL